MMGPAGGAIRGVMSFVFGLSAFLTPAIFAVMGLRAGDWMSRERAIRVGSLFGGLLLLGPVLLLVLGAEVAAGWVGEEIGGALTSLVGTLGALIITSVGLVALSVGTVGWNPLRSLVRGMRAGGDAAGRTARATAKVLADKGKELAEARGQRAASGVVVIGEPEAEAVPGMQPEWAGLEASEPGREPEEEVAVQAEVAVEEPVSAAEPDEPEDDESASADSAREDWGDEVPPMELLSAPEARDRESMDRQLDELGKILVEKLKTFNVQSELGGRTTGPVVTQFEIVPAPGVKVNRIANLDADLALAMKAHAIRIVAPIPGKGAVGVEIPNPRPEIVNLREVLESNEFRNAKGELPLALGKDLTGKPYVATLEKMPHVLIAGATGSGKSVCLNTIVTSLVYKHTPETLRLLMIDPKMVELSVYSMLPHLRKNVVTDPRDAAGVLGWAVLEMERRYALMKANQVRSIQEFNRKVRTGALLRRSEPKGPEGDEDRWIYKDGVLPYIVVVVDELADLMMTVQSEVEKPLTQLAQKARAIGIHLIVATQRPSVNVITGLIKANFPTRIAFRVASKTDSRTILDQNGADALLGNGDMLFLPPGQSDPVRIQGAYLPTEDTERLMSWYVELLERRPGAGEPFEEEPDILEELRVLRQEDAAAAAEEITGDWDELFRQAAELCIQNGGGSTSLLQRRLSIGYGRAARIVDQLFDAGVLGPSDGAKGREVLMGMDELDAMFGGSVGP
jgi:S-DNA-T family DNA segregation ATPase FtsK/SpoIIIE